MQSIQDTVEFKMFHVLKIHFKAISMPFLPSQKIVKFYVNRTGQNNMPLLCDAAENWGIWNKIYQKVMILIKDNSNTYKSCHLKNNNKY